MILHYTARQSSLPSEDGKKKWYLSLVKNDKIIDTNQLGKDAAEISTLSPGDMANAAHCLFTLVGRYLRAGYSVRLDTLGTFTLRAKCTGRGVDNPEDVNPSQIKSLRVQFTPEYKRNSFEGTTRALFSGIQFRRWENKGPVTDADVNDPADGGNDDEWQDPDA